MTALATCSEAWLKQASSSPGLQQLLTPRGSQFWPHQPTPRQIQGLVAHRFLPEDEPSEVFYGGAAGGGKSDWLLMGGLEYADVPGYAAIVFRRTYTDLSLPGAIMARAKQWLGLDYWHEQRKQFTFPGGASLTFAYLRRDDDVYRYQSAEFQYVGFDELTQFSEFQYTYLFSRLRRPDQGPLSEVPLRMRAASNPGGIGHGWVKKRFPIDGRPRGRRVFIPAKLEDNPHLDREAYKKTLAHLPEVTREQLLNGDWGVFEGMAFASFNRDLHVVDGFDIPPEWQRFESHDHGIANPTATLAWAVDYDGNLVTFDMYYRPGLVSVHAAGIQAKRDWWWPKDDRGWPTQTPVSWADPSMWARTGAVTQMGDPASIITEYADHDLAGFTPANNDRRAGRARLLELLEPDPNRPFPAWHPRYGEYGAPRWFIVRGACQELLEQIENAPVNEDPVGESIGIGEIVDPKWESAHGHAIAAARYGAMSRPSASEEPVVEPDDPRAAAWQRSERQLDDDIDMDDDPFVRRI